MNENINLIAELIFDTGDIRKGLNIIRNSVKIAESLDQPEVNQNHIFLAIEHLIPSSYDDSFNTLNRHQILILKALILLEIKPII